MPPCLDQARRKIFNRFQEVCMANLMVMQVNPIQVEALITMDRFLLVDGSFLNGDYGCAMISLTKGSLDWWFNSSSGCCGSALEAKMEAVLLALKWVVEHQWDHVSIASDSKALWMLFVRKEPRTGNYLLFFLLSYIAYFLFFL
uniref:RNase H type-1 domain-containing protein n=1 Tax=Cannabis sativa TaxID=3483 RepID=A0A803R4E3_CANSA